MNVTLIIIAIVLLAISNAQIAYAAWKVTRFLNEPEESNAAAQVQQWSPQPVEVVPGYEQQSKPSRASMAGLRAQVAMAVTPEQEKEERISRRNS